MPAWANVAHKTDIAAKPASYSSDQADVHRLTMQYLAALQAGESAEATALLVTPQEGRLQDKLRLWVAREIELMRGGDLQRVAVAPVQVEGDWALVVGLEKHPKADRDQVKLARLLLHREDNVWKVVPDIVYSDPAINVTRNHSAQHLQRWFRRHQQVLRHQYVAPLIKGDAMPDAMRHLAQAPPFNLTSLRDPFASYMAAVAKHGAEMLRRRKSRVATRPHEEMENFDLSALHLVAIYAMNGKRVAMLEDNEGKGHVVQVGNYMGKYNGKIIAIDPGVVHLLEEVVNPAGALVHKEVKIPLMDAKK